MHCLSVNPGVWVIDYSSKSLAADSIEVTSEFVCGAGEGLVQVEKDHYLAVIPSDPPSTARAKGYDYYFCLRIKNFTEQTRHLTLEARRSNHSNSPKWHQSRVPLFVSDDFYRWYVLDGVESSPAHEEFRMTLSLPPGHLVYVTNSLPYPSARMEKWLKQKAETSDWAMLQSIGKSVQGRDILLLSITDPNVRDTQKDRILVTSGFHPAEPDWLATTTIIEALLGETDWAEQIRRNFVIDIIPQTNPDGFDLGTNGCNAHDINLYWDFRRHDLQTSPEAVHLWRWVEVHPPSLYIDFHAYVHQLYKDFRPYIRPTSDYPPLARPVVRAIDKALIALCEGRSVTDSSTSDPCTLAVQLTKEFGTITYPKFHLHLNHGVPACRQLGLDVFRTIITNALPFRPLYPKTVGADRKRRRTNHILRWWERGYLPMRARRAWRRLGNLTGLRPSIRKAVFNSSQPGLAPYWLRHLWSQRGQVEPVIVIGPG